MASFKNVKGYIVQALRRAFAIIPRKNIDCFQDGLMKQRQYRLAEVTGKWLSEPEANQ